MSATGPLDSAWFKWWRAVTHVNTLYTDYIKGVIDGNRKPRFGFTYQYDAHRHGFPLVISSVESMPTQWSLLLGDIVFNFHSCLDHVAWALVHRGTALPLTDRQASRVYFPIADSPETFRKVTPSKLPGIKRADLAVVRRYQPYRDGKRRVPLHCFSILSAMSGEDKHRAIRPLWLLPTSAECEVRNATDCNVTRIPSRGRTTPLKVDTELTCIYVKKTGPEPQIDVNFNFTAKPAVTERVDVYEWSRLIATFTSQLLKEFSPPPEEVIDWVAALPDDGPPDQTVL